MLVVAGDMLFDAAAFDIELVVRCFRQHSAPLCACYPMRAADDTRTRGIVALDPASGRITDFVEKPAPGTPHATSQPLSAAEDAPSRLASVVLYCLPAAALAAMAAFTPPPRAPIGMFVEHLLTLGAVYGPAVAAPTHG